MELGIFAKTFGKSTAMESLDAVRSAGLHVAHYNMVCSGLTPMPDTIPDAEDARIQSATVSCGVNLVAISGTYNMIHPEVAIRKQGLMRLKTLAALCKSIKVSIITLCTGTRHPTNKWAAHPGNNEPSAWKDLCIELEQALQIATDFNIMLAFEPEVANVVNTCKKGQRLLNEMGSDRLGVIFDPANLFETATRKQQHYIIKKGLELVGEALVMAHAKDRAEDGAFCAAGKGCLDYPYFIDALRSTNFNGPLIMHGLLPDEVPGSVRFLRALL